MSTPDTRIVLGHISCPICDWTEDVYAVPVVPTLAAVFGLSGEALAAIHGDQERKRRERSIEQHLATHTTAEWVTALLEARAQLAAFASRSAD